MLTTTINQAPIELGRSVCYLRVSTRGQAERDGERDGYSIPAQREACKHGALLHCAPVVKEFADRGASAKSTDRPALQAMLAYIQDRENGITHLVVHKLDRLARNREDDVMISKILQKAGVKLVSVSEGVDDSPAGSML